MKIMSQVDDNASSGDQISHRLASSSDENKTSMQSQKDADISTISSERVQSAQQTSNRSDVSSENGPPFNKDRKDRIADRTGEVSQGDPTTTAPYHYEQLKTDQLSCKENGEAVQLSSVDSADPKSCQSLNGNSENSHFRQDICGSLHPTESDESKNLQEPESSVTTTKSEPESACIRSPHEFKFDLNEGMEVDEAECPHPSLSEVESSVLAVHASEPIPVVAKVGVPIGLPRKPLQFGGELGWRRSGTTSAFRPTYLRKSDRENGGCGHLSHCGSRKSLFSQGIDLNIAAVESELPGDKTSVDASLNQSKRFLFDLNCQSENDAIHHKPGASDFDLNDNPVIEDTRKRICRPGESQQLLRNYIAVDTVACSGGSGSTTTSNSGRLSNWVDLSSVRGFSNAQAQPFLVAAPTAEQVQMMVPIQSEISFLPNGPSGFYIGKINGLSPQFYSPNVLPHLNNHHGAAIYPQISGPVLTTYPGTVHVLESGLNPNAYSNKRPTFHQNGSLALMENGSRGGNNFELLVPARNTLFEERMKQLEQVAYPGSFAKRREPDGGWDSTQISYTRTTPWS